MRVKVVRKYRDKYTLIIHTVGETVDMTPERYQEIAAAGLYVEPMAEAQAADTVAETVPHDRLDDMTIRELREYADTHYKMTFRNGMKKTEIIEALRKRTGK